jgi:lipopolysaccharide biosynthesis regulator YciM
MEFDLGWLLWGLPIAFGLGWVASRLDLRQMRIENRQAPKAYFRGLNHLLNEQQDQAIDAFIEAVRNDPDTSELHFALGNLFRRRGEYERAVRVHEHLLSRGDLSRTDRQRAQHALALDFLKAGLLDRAEEALRKLDGTSFQEQALLALLAIYERSRDWTQAAEIARRLDAELTPPQYATRRAHYLCELAAQAEPESAERLLRDAMAVAPGAARPAMDLAALQRRIGQPAASFDTLAAAVRQAPASIGLAARPLAESATAAGRPDEALAILQASYEQSHSLDVLEAIVALEPAERARDWYVRHLEREPSLVAATKWLADEKLEHEQFHPHVQRALDHAVKPLTRYRCVACGFEAKQHFWQCPGCQAWDSYPARRVEEL